MTTSRSSASFLTLFLASPLAAQGIPGTATLVKDVNEAPSPVVQSSEPRFEGTFDGITYFIARPPSTGYELWRTDGTEAGTWMVKDILPGPETSVPADLYQRPDGTILFRASDEYSDSDLWKTDGTPEGTVKVAEIDEEGSALPFNFFEFEGETWFLARSEAHGLEFWKTDGTEEGTVIAYESVPGPDGWITNSWLVGDTIVWRGSPGAGSALYATDGSAPSELLGTWSGTANVLTHTAVINDKLVFNARSHDGIDDGWWVTDGTAAGTFQLVSSPYHENSWIIPQGNRAFFVADVPDGQPELWITDGTLENTEVVVDTYPGSFGQGPSGLPGIAVDNGLIYVAQWPTFGYELTYTNGTAAGTFMIRDIYPGTQSGGGRSFVRLDDEVYFLATSPGQGLELWRSDGTEAGTQPVADTVPGPDDGFYQYFVLEAGADSVFFGAWVDGVEGDVELFRADAAGAELVVELSPEALSVASNPEELTRLGDLVIFAAEDERGVELWRSDGTDAGTELILDIAFEGFSSNPSDFVLFGDRVFFTADTVWPNPEDTGRELWVTDGTAAGTHLVLDLNPGGFDSNPGHLTVVGERLFFAASQIGIGRELFVTDGTAAGTTLVADVNPSASISSPTPASLTALGDLVIFEHEQNDGEEPFVSDGTEAGTFQLADLRAGTLDSSPNQLTAFGDLVIMNAWTDVGTELVVTDGTVAGTVVIDVNAGPNSSYPGYFAPLGDEVVFAASHLAQRLWKTDGTPEGTELLGGPSGLIAYLTTSGDRVYFAHNFFDDEALWVTDGTSVGTALVSTFSTSSSLLELRDLWAFGTDGSIAFAGVSETGAELWISDGTEAGTLPLTDTWLGPLDSDPKPGLRVGDRVFFSADDGVTGRELHSLALEDTGVSVAEAQGVGCTGANGTFGLNATSNPVLGGFLELELRSGPVGAPTWMLFGSGYFPAAVGTCSVTIGAPVIAGPVPLGSAGELDLAFAVPFDTALVGLPLAMQFFAVEAGGPFAGLGVLSNALEILTGP